MGHQSTPFLFTRHLHRKISNNKLSLSTYSQICLRVVKDKKLLEKAVERRRLEKVRDIFGGELKRQELKDLYRRRRITKADERGLTQPSTSYAKRNLKK